jgi:hypothetical protein
MNTPGSELALLEASDRDGVDPTLLSGRPVAVVHPFENSPELAVDNPLSYPSRFLNLSDAELAAQILGNGEARCVRPNPTPIEWDKFREIVAYDASKQNVRAHEMAEKAEEAEKAISYEVKKIETASTIKINIEASHKMAADKKYFEALEKDHADFMASIDQQVAVNRTSLDAINGKVSTFSNAGKEEFLSIFEDVEETGTISKYEIRIGKFIEIAEELEKHGFFEGITPDFDTTSKSITTVDSTFRYCFKMLLDGYKADDSKGLDSFFRDPVKLAKFTIEAHTLASESEYTASLNGSSIPFSKVEGALRDIKKELYLPDNHKSLAVSTVDKEVPSLDLKLVKKLRGLTADEEDTWMTDHSRFPDARSFVKALDAVNDYRNPANSRALAR